MPFLEQTIQKTVRALLKLVEENAADLAAAIKADLNRSADFEIPTIVRATKDFIDNLEQYTQNQKGINVADKDESYVRFSPLYVTLLFDCWCFLDGDGLPWLCWG
jgi:acyl-CoA reductase-like NAD-dependent aldehyde dehydrogenase